MKNVATKQTPGALKHAFSVFEQKHTFSPGDLVEWKPGMKNKNAFAPLVVIEVLAEPALSPEESAGSPYFREPLDIILGLFDSDGDFLLFHCDSRRLQPYSGE